MVIDVFGICWNARLHLTSGVETQQRSVVSNGLHLVEQVHGTCVEVLPGSAPWRRIAANSSRLRSFLSLADLCLVKPGIEPWDCLDRQQKVIQHAVRRTFPEAA